MAALPRVTGPITYKSSREITSTKTGTPINYTFHTATVLVGGRGTVDVSIPGPERAQGRLFNQGDQVDWLCTADVYGNRVQVDFVDDYPVELRESEADQLLTLAGSSAGADLS